MNQVATALVGAFRVEADAAVEAVAILLVDDGFDAQTMRVLAAWQNAPIAWSAPKRKCPDGGKPTAAAWAWLVAGLEVDYDAIASTANVTRQVARAKVAMLLGGRLVLPDGSLAKPARASLQQHARRALGLKTKMPAAAPKPVDDGNTN